MRESLKWSDSKLILAEVSDRKLFVRAYELPTIIVRTDTTSFSVNHDNQRDSEENLLRHGYSKDKHPTQNLTTKTLLHYELIHLCASNQKHH